MYLKTQKVKPIKKALYIFSILVASCLPIVSWADCVNPAAEEGVISYNATVNAVQFCNGSDWVNTGLKVPSATGTSCTNPSADEGSMYYNTTVNTVQFCNGDNWIKMGTIDNSSATGTACTTPTAPEGAIIYNSTHSRVQFCNGDNWVNATYYAQGYLASLFEGAQLHKLVDGVSGNRFGASVDINGDKAIVGAYYNSTGRAYIFNANTGALVHTLLAVNGKLSDYFGYSVAIDGDRAIVGAIRDDENGNSSGAAHVFDVNTGAHLHKLIASDGLASDIFGESVSISGDKAIVGAWGRDDNGSASGTAYIFDITTGTQLHKLLPTDGADSDQFGRSVSISGDRAIVGAFSNDDNGATSGSAYIFNVNTGVQLYKLLPSDGAAGDSFGYSVAIHGSNAIVGSSADDDNGSSSGSAYIFDVTTGSQLYKLLPDDGAANDTFGWRVSLDDKRAIISAHQDDDNGAESGSAYVFDVATGTQLYKLLPDDGVASDAFGSSVSISGGKAIVGELNDNSASGAAYIFD